MRGLKKEHTPILRGYQVFHSFIRPREGLNGKTPAEACAIEVGGEDKWMALSQEREPSADRQQSPKNSGSSHRLIMALSNAYQDLVSTLKTPF